VSEGNDLANSLVDVYLNDGTDAFTHGTATGGEGARRLVLADLNGDGKLDVALTDYWAASADVAVLLGRGDGTFRAQKRYPVGSRPRGSRRPTSTATAASTSRSRASTRRRASRTRSSSSTTTGTARSRRRRR
jgi:hypothetical protein